VPVVVDNLVDYRITASDPGEQIAYLLQEEVPCVNT